MAEPGPVKKATKDFYNALMTPDEGGLCQNQNYSEDQIKECKNTPGCTLGRTTSSAANEAMRELTETIMIARDGKDPSEADRLEFEERYRQASDELQKLCDNPREILEKRMEPTPFQFLTIMETRHTAERNRKLKEQLEKKRIAFENILELIKKLRAGKAKPLKPLPETKVAIFFSEHGQL